MAAINTGLSAQGFALELHAALLPCQGDASADVIDGATTMHAPECAERVSLPKGWSAVAALAQRWDKEAGVLIRNSRNLDETKRLCDGETVAIGISTLGLNPPKMQSSLSEYRVSVCKKGGREQGIMVATINRRISDSRSRDISNVQIVWLMTRPGNLCISAEHSEERFPGVGSCLVEDARSSARKEGIAYVLVFAMMRARGFYERCGFIDIKDFCKKHAIDGLARFGNMAALAAPSATAVHVDRFMHPKLQEVTQKVDGSTSLHAALPPCQGDASAGVIDGATAMHARTVHAPECAERVSLPDGWPAVAALAKRWKEEASDLILKPHDLNEERKLSNSLAVAGSISCLDLDTRKEKPRLPNYRVSVCKKGGREQGIMTATIYKDSAKPSFVEIDWLMTRPGNLCTSAEHSQERCPGVGSCLVKHVRRLAEEEGIAYVVVCAKMWARSFYEHCGFMYMKEFCEQHAIVELPDRCNMAALAAPSAIAVRVDRFVRPKLEVTQTEEED